MARLTLVSRDGNAKGGSAATAGHRKAPTEGEAVRQLLEAHDYHARRQSPTNGQYEFRCPFHEGSGELGRKSTNFYVDAKSGVFYCQSAACGEKGNLVLLERFFGIDADPNLSVAYRSRDVLLKSFQSALTYDRRQVFYDKGLNDVTIDRFRLGFCDGSGTTTCPLCQVIHTPRYIIPYLDGRRPTVFRYYSPDGSGPHGTKYWWEADAEARLFNVGDAVGDANSRVFITEGEAKAMLLTQMGFAAVSVPGAAMWKPEWSQSFNHAKHVVVVFDNDNPDDHHYKNCRKCGTVERDECSGHNPGQEAAARLLDTLGYRAKNVVLPRPEGERKTDVNEYFMRDGRTLDDFSQLTFGLKSSPFLVRTLAEIRADPPDEAVFLVDEGILPVGGRLLITGAPKAGKSILVENLALSLASGVPFLGQFKVLKPTRVLLLDRELSERSLFDRLSALIDSRMAYRAAEPFLHIDHATMFTLDAPNAEQTLIGLIRANNAEVVIFDTAYKFFGGDMESSSAVKKAFGTLDKVIAETNVSVVLTHHHRKKTGQHAGKEERPDPDQVVGSFLWTGWPNATVLLNFLNRRVESPFNTICSFTAFRDAAPPEPLALYRDRDSIAYKSIVPYSFDDEGGSQWQVERRALTYDNLANFLLECAPVVEADFLHIASGVFGVREDTVRLHLMDILDRHADFTREGTGTRALPYVWKYKHEYEEESYEQGLARQMEMDA